VNQSGGGLNHIFPKRYADFVQRFRVAFGFVLLVGFAFLTAPTPASLAVGLPVSVLGLALRGWAAGHLAKDARLATSGPYAYIRNPLYLGTLLAALGIVIASRSLWLAIIFVVAFALIYLPAVELEEQHLLEIFPDYLAYAARIPRFWPRTRWPGELRAFSWPLYRKNEEYKAVLGFLIAICWLLWRCWLRSAVT
jgi:protein-S-isoprenylcysteine O-methyltransferase Ste14